MRPPNPASIRVEEKRRAIRAANPNPPRSELVDMMLAEAKARQGVLDESKPAKSSGLSAAQRQPARQPAAKPAPPPPTALLTDDEAAFFENLLAPAPPADNTTDDHHDDN